MSKDFKRRTPRRDNLDGDEQYRECHDEIMAQADRTAVESDRQGRSPVPSDDDIGKMAYEFCDETGASGETPRFIGEQSIVRLVRAALARYGNPHIGQPAASAEPVRVDCGECPNVSAGCEAGKCLRAAAPVAAQAQPVEGQCDCLDGDEECREVHEWIMQQAATRPSRRATSARITPELRRDVLAALQQGKTVREIRETFGISHKSLVKIRDGKV